MNKILINFKTCSPAPPGGYKIYYRVGGSSSPYQLAGSFYATPAVFYDDNVAGTCYEGFMVTDCGDDVFGNHIPFDTCSSTVTNPDNSSCGTSLNFETTDLAYTNLGLFDLHVEGAVLVKLVYNTLDRPNRFTLYEDGGNIATSGWKGYAPYIGPWGSSLSTSPTGEMDFHPLPGKLYQVRIEAGNAGPSPYDITDNFLLQVICSG